MKLRLWFTERFLFGHQAVFFEPPADDEDDAERDAAIEAHQQATDDMDRLYRKIDEVTLVMNGSGKNGHA